MKALLFILFLTIPTLLFSQAYSLSGVIIDETNTPVESAACILRSANDTLVIKSILSNAQGEFVITQLPKGEYVLHLQHMSYDKEQYAISIEDQDIDMPPFVLLSASKTLDDVVFSVESPMVKAQDGKLIYDAPRLAETKVATNAMDLLRNIPSIMSSGGDDLRLIGATEFTILINGQPSSMNKDQLISMLKAMPASRVANVEVMYSAPPQYNIRGAAINVVLSEQAEGMPILQGETRVEYRQRHYAGFEGGVSLLYNKSSFSADLAVIGIKSKGWTENRMYAVHQYNDRIYDITQQNGGISYYDNLNVRLGLNYAFKNKDKLQFVYTGDYDETDDRPTSNTVFLEDMKPYKDINTRSNSNGNEYLHNLRMDYNSRQHLNIGIDYTLYIDPGTQIYRDYEGTTIRNQYKTKTEQTINKVLLFANHSITAGSGWDINYGAKFSYSRNNNDYDYYKLTDNLIPDSINRIKQNEYMGTVFGGFTKSFTEKLSLQASLSANYFNSTIDEMGSKKTLWNDFQPFANANLTYNNGAQLYQLSFSSDINYPPYWALSSNAWQMNAYSIIKGNPELKFSRDYKTQFVFMLNHKYTLVAYYEYSPERFFQLPYQSQNRLENVFQMMNLDYEKTYGLTFIVPFKARKVLDTKLSLNLFRQEQKDDSFYENPYKRSKNTFMGQLTNTINVSSKPNIKLDISAFYMHGALQGVFDIGHMSNITAGAKWLFWNNNAELMIQSQDIFKGSGARTFIDFGNQYSKMRITPDLPIFRISFLYRFGKYKKPNVEDVDRSRFGKGG